MQTEDITITTVSDLRLGDRVTFREEKRPYTVRAAVPGGRFFILTKPFNVQRTVLYTIIDRGGRMRGVVQWPGDPAYGVRGPDDRVFGMGYETQQEIDERAAELAAGEIEVSMRRRITTQIVRVQRPVALVTPATP
jgi:hypothetical protein